MVATPVCSPRRLLLALLLLGSVLPLSGCFFIRGFYVVQETPILEQEGVKGGSVGPSIVVKFEYQANGRVKKSLSRKFEKRAAEIVRETHMFRSVDVLGDEAEAELEIIINDPWAWGDMWRSLGRGVLSGATFGLIGTRVEDELLVTGRLTRRELEVDRVDFKWKFISTSGILFKKKDLEGLERYGYSLDAFDRLLTQVILTYLKDLHSRGDI